MARGKHRDHLLDIGVVLFSDRGFSATGVQEIMTAAEMPKGSFYSYFPSKEAFAIEVLERYRGALCDELRMHLAEAEGSPVERLRGLFAGLVARKAKSAASKGCLAGRLAQELAGENPAFREPLERTFALLAEGLSVLLQEAQEVGELGPDVDREAYAAFLISAWQGALLRAKSADSDLPIRQFFEFALGRLLQPVTSSV